MYGFKGRKLKNGTLENQEFIENIPRQALHSKTIDFYHPITKEKMHFESALPSDMKELIKILNG